MKSKFKIILIVIFWGLINSSFSQDIIVKLDEDTINCKIIKTDSKIIFYQLNNSVDTLLIDKDEVFLFKRKNSASVKISHAETFIPPSIPLIPIDSVTRNVYYKGIVNMDSISKLELYLRANQWFAKVYKSANNVIQLNDKQEGQIIGKANVKIMYPTGYGNTMTEAYLKYTIMVSLKEEKYKYEIVQLYYESTASSTLPVTEPMSEKMISYEEYYKKIKEEAKKRGDAWAITEKLVKKFYYGQIELLKRSDKEIKELITSLKTGMNTPSVSSSDW